ncbi:MULTISPECIES: hypothetical protein [unclassified Microcoleus]|uniref:hypothetical protein n=1 Tax=unclassified Microcoleus TaxID=2642155 RepID=UPI001D333B7B|nr:MULTISPECIES: hypothetical protein [unclassified Microcoleus]MCC3443212.1 hypothetical protein [Microcoleus sp. PH2017_03_ELD_O_A]MCC3468076.1 hypothetical protein [Microcoleus sp. PH2017_06_SFM_O_A]MCC3506221.1 hypothetical protein [Microcoleus sp. PH2017_19_SFW_U_A]MCC3412584.1 hypothetical protein [Microcoleus sp. PH2017_02_FOX_O_A]MCC3425619.1 hypothetical protein [Microcoleus sp. PH2017_01_SCD_O_A]
MNSQRSNLNHIGSIVGNSFLIRREMTQVPTLKPDRGYFSGHDRTDNVRERGRSHF